MSIHNLCIIFASVLVLTNAANATGPKINPAPNLNISAHKLVIHSEYMDVVKISKY